MNSICEKIKQFLYSIYNKFVVNRFRILILGLKNSSKSSVIPTAFEGTFPTTKIVKKIKYHNYNEEGICFEVVDIPGSNRYRHKWDYYYRKCDVLLFCVDLTANEESWKVSREELRSLLYRNIWRKKNLLILGTKNDLPDAKEIKDLILKLDLLSITDREIACYSVSAKDGININLIKPWIIEQYNLKKDKSKLKLFN